ncbi:MAG: DUF6079 family protein, partial [Bacillota bacterium]
MSRIRDLIEVPEVKTVIQMSDIEDPELRDFLTESFLLTDEVREVLLSFFRGVVRGEGKGYWLEGNFGSGKSHLLTVISLLLSRPESWQPILEQDNSGEFTDYYEKVSGEDYRTVNISLVEHSSGERLEEIVNDTLRRSLASELPGREDYRRRDFYYGAIEEVLAASSGIVILIDELSEFLRSKPDGRSFNEDIRYLQFMGEFVAGRNCWLMATLQEAIEKTGEITQEIFGKIKDRYPVHFHLTGTHIREIVARRLIRKRAGARSEIEGLYEKYADSFSGWPVEREEFVRLYPVNPLAVPLLDNLKPLFSQHRGIIDFIHYRIKGDDSRGIAGILDEPADCLLNPDLIFDHFLDRLRERMETRRYYEKVYRYYEQELGNILPAEDVDAGLKIIKLLVLFAVSPVDKEYRVRDIAHMLMEPVTDLDPAANYEYINDLLQKMYRHGAYLVREARERTGDHVYSLSLEADVNLIIREKTRFIRSNFFAGEERIFTRVGQLVEESYLPLARLLEKPKMVRRVRWQKTDRSGYFCLLPLTDITLKSVGEFAERLSSADLEREEGLKDFVIFMGYPLQVEEQREHLREVVMPELAAGVRSAFCFWLPREVEARERLEEILSRQLLREEYADKEGETASAVREKLDELLQEDTSVAADIFRSAYFEGDIVDGDGESPLVPAEVGPVSFSRFVERTASQLLEKRYPAHVRIAPYQSVIGEGQLNRLCRHFLSAGVVEENDARSYGILNVIEDVMKPLGIIKKRGKKIRLNIKPGKNPLLEAFFSLLEEERTDVTSVFSALRRGNYGLTAPSFKLLVLALLYSGYITAYSEKQKISLQKLSAYNFDRISYLGYGEIIGEDFQRVLQECSLYPPRFRDQPFSLPLQQEMWEYTAEWKREKAEELENLKTRITGLSLDGEQALAGEKELLNNLEKVSGLLTEIKVSYSAEEGLERFASAYRSLPNADRYLERFERMQEFFEEGYGRYAEIRNYLERLPELPETEEYRQVVELRDELLDGLQDRDIIFTEDFLSELEERFREFRDLYSEAYSSEHRRKLSGERFKSYRKLKQGSPYQVLAYLADIEMISVRDDLIKVKRRLGKVLGRECERLNRSQLRHSPLCECGFKPGDKIETIPLEELHSLIAKGIAAYLQQLDGEEFRPRIEEYLDNMEQVGEKRFARPLRELLKLAEDAGDQIDRELVEKLEDLLNRNVIKRINRALAGSVNLLERDLDSLYENLVGRSFSPQQIRRIFRDWLEAGEKLDKHTYIKIVSGDQGAGGEDGELASFLEEYFPELLPLLERKEEEEFALFTALQVWEELFGLSASGMEEISGESLLEAEKMGLPDAETCLDFWQKLFEFGPGERLRGGLDSLLEEENIGHRLLERLSPESIEDIAGIIEKDFISNYLAGELLVMLVRKAEMATSVPGEIISSLRQAAEESLVPGASDYKTAAADYLQLVVLLEQLQGVAGSGENTGKVAGDGDSDIKAEEVEWEKVYAESLSRLEFLCFRFLAAAKESGLASALPVEGLKRKVRKTVAAYGRAFSSQITAGDTDRVRESGTPYLAGEEIYTLPRLLLEDYSRLTDRVRAAHRCRVLMDGMRQDTWEVIREELEGRLSLRTIREGLLYSLPPTNTENQLDFLRESGFEGEVISPQEFKVEEIDEREGDLVKFSYVDDRVHSSKEDYPAFMEEIAFRTENTLVPFLERLPARTAVLLVSDHGYRINYNFSERNKYESPRYLHGGETPFEV